jgi:carbonic anhydrase
MNTVRGGALVLDNRCGAAEAAIDVVTKGVVPPGEIGAATAPIVPAVQAVQSQPADQLLDAAIEENVRQTAQSLGQVPRSLSSSRAAS